MTSRTALLTAITMLAFAANSLLCRAALGPEHIDPASFTTVRILSGAAALAVLVRAVRREPSVTRSRGTWRSGLALFGYAAAFSLAYVSLDTGVGALILFGAVQLSMIGWAVATGERLRALQWGGVLVALGGLVYLLLPGATAPPPLGALLMCISGASWGWYSIRGKEAAEPLVMTAGNFARATPMTLTLSAGAIAALGWFADPIGVALAATSGAITSGLGYALWYLALRRLTTTAAAVVQLTVPVIAAFAGVLVLDEPVTARLVLTSVAILGGIALVVTQRAPDPR